MNNETESFENNLTDQSPSEAAPSRPLWATLLKWLIYIPAIPYFFLLLILNFRLSNGILHPQFVIWLTLFVLGFAIWAASSKTMDTMKKWVALLPILLFILIYGTPL